MLLSVREYERIKVDEGSKDHSSPSITRTQANLLTNLRAKLGFDVFKFVNANNIAAQQYVGVIKVGTLTIEVLPKIDTEERAVRKNLVAMIAATLDLPIKDSDMAYVGTQSHCILEVLIRLFCRKLYEQLRRGLVRTYEGREENLSVLRGRLDVVQQIRANIGNPERLYCRYEDLLDDIPLNQILKAAVRLLLNAARDVANQRLLAELLLMLDSVADVPISKLAWHRVHFDRMSERFRSPYKMAEMFLKNCPPDVTGGQFESFSLFFDMNVLFEEYIGRTLQKIMHVDGMQIHLQGKGGNQKYVSKDSSGTSAFAMRPDVAARKDGRYEWLLDTKWKLLSSAEFREGVLQSDLYQMYTYASCYDCPQVILLYPHHDELGNESGLRQTFALNPWLENGTSKHVKVGSIDLRELESVPRQLRALLQ